MPLNYYHRRFSELLFSSKDIWPHLGFNINFWQMLSTYSNISILWHISFFPKKQKNLNDWEWRITNYSIYIVTFFSSYVQYFLYSEYRIFFRDIFYVYIQIWQQLSINVQFKGSTERRGSLIYQSLSVTYTCRGWISGTKYFSV